MADVALAARLSLGLAFILSARAKLADRPAFAAALGDFGVPAGTALSVVLPAVELALALVLVVVRERAWPAWAALGLLGATTGQVLANLSRGRRVPCPCFEVHGERPISAATLIRNGWLIALGILATAPATPVHPGAAVPATAVLAGATLVVLRRVG
jgi:methylamine utilization protein MauE